MINQRNRWITLDGAVNARDLGGLPTANGHTTRHGRVLRADNLQDLTHTDLRLLLDDYGLKNVIDLRSEPEVRLEGPGPLTRVPAVTIHRLSLFIEDGRPAGAPVDTAKVLPWQQRRDNGPHHQRSISHYLGYLGERADSIVTALRVMSRADGSSLVHCAAGKDRTGVVCALALEVAGVTREAIIADYAQTGDRLTAILARLRSSQTYAADLAARPPDSHHPHASIMERFLAIVDERHGGTLSWLATHGWTATDTAALRTRLLT